VAARRSGRGIGGSFADELRGGRSRDSRRPIATRTRCSRSCSREISGFVKGELTHPRRKPDDFMPLAEGQAPLAAVVGCADSRVAPELIFDQGVGDLFVVRIAGNIISGAGASVKGSIEYAVAELGVRLIMVLGHSRCGAVHAAIKHIDAKDALPGSIATWWRRSSRPWRRRKAGRAICLDNVIKAKRRARRRTPERSGTDPGRPRQEGRG